MTKLSTDKFSLARRFILDNALPIDIRMFEYQFEGGRSEAVFEELKAYQNADGGFGHGIEPDFRLPASSPMATSIGLQICLDLGASPQHEMVAAAIEYLVSAFDRQGAYWAHTSMEVNDYPHAPWWGKADDAPPGEAGWSNPSAELLGYLFYASEHVPQDILEQARRRGEKNLASGMAFGKEINVYQLLTWERARPHLPQSMRVEVTKHLRDVYAGLNPSASDQAPEVDIVALAPNPAALINSVMPGAVAAQYKKVLEKQDPEGAWWPEWSWGQFEDIWPRVRVEWAGKITLGILRSLREFGLLENENG